MGVHDQRSRRYFVFEHRATAAVQQQPCCVSWVLCLRMVGSILTNKQKKQKRKIYIGRVLLFAQNTVSCVHVPVSSTFYLRFTYTKTIRLITEIYLWKLCIIFAIGLFSYSGNNSRKFLNFWTNFLCRTLVITFMNKQAISVIVVWTGCCCCVSACNVRLHFCLHWIWNLHSWKL